DVARMLVRSIEELAETDIADYALETLRHSAVQTVYLIGRRGPVQAAFTRPELKALQRLNDVDVVTDPQEVELDEHSQAELDSAKEKSARQKYDILRSMAEGPRRSTGNKRIEIRFLLSPVEARSDGSGGVGSL